MEALAKLYGIDEHGNSIFKGTAFAISKDQALTAFHCVGNRQLREVTYWKCKLAFVAQGITIDADVLKWDPELDIAVLKIKEPLQNYTPFSIFSKPIVQNMPYSALGFPSDSEQEIAISGTITHAHGNSKTGTPVIQLDCKQVCDEKPLNLPGLSGGPLLIQGMLAGVIHGDLRNLDGTGGTAAGIVFATPIQAAIEIGLIPNTAINSHSIPPYGLPVENFYFQGRCDYLETLRQTLYSGQKASVRQTINGLGGIGKSSLVVQYAHQNIENYDLIAFLPAEQPEVLQSKLLDLAEHLKEELNELCSFGEDAEQKIKGLKKWLSENHRWLLIFDNADEDPSMNAIQTFLPSLIKGHALITSRKNDCLPWGFGQGVTLAEFPLEEAIEFLVARLDINESEKLKYYNAAKELAEELGCLPLALEQAAAYIKKTHISFESYLQKYRSIGLPLLAEYLRYTVLENKEKHVASTGLLNLEAVSQENPLLIEFLKFSALMAPETIPFAWVTEGLFKTLPEQFIDYHSIDNVKCLIAPLDEFSLIKFDGPKLKETGYKLHRLVQKVLQFKLIPEKEQLSDYRQKCITALNKTFPGWNNVYHWPKDFYIQGLWFSQQDVVADSELPLLAELIRYCACYTHWVTGDYKAAEPLHQKALRICLNNLGKFHQDTALSYNNLAGLYHDQGNYREAEPLYKIALKIREAVLGKEHTETASSYGNLANLCKAQKKYLEAEILYKKALEIEEAILGVEHLNTATTYGNLAGLYLDQKKYLEAETLQKKALEIRKVYLEKEHPQIATSYANLAGIYHDQGNTKEAEPLFKKALAIREAKLGKVHPDTAISYGNLADLYQTQRKSQEAELFYIKALQILLKHSPKSLITKITIKNLKILYKQLGYKEAYQNARLKKLFGSHWRG